MLCLIGSSGGAKCPLLTLFPGGYFFHGSAGGGDPSSRITQISDAGSKRVRKPNIRYFTSLKNMKLSATYTNLKKILVATYTVKSCMHYTGVCADIFSEVVVFSADHYRYIIDILQTMILAPF